MRLSELLRCTHFRVATGLAPPIEALDSEVDRHSSDWLDAPARRKEDGAVEALSGRNPPQNGRSIEAAVLRVWNLFSKAEDNSISQEEYGEFVRRVARVLLPGLDPEQETLLARNTWEEDAGSAHRLAFAPFFSAVVRLAKTWTDSHAPCDLADFVDDLLMRITRAQVTIGDTGEVVEKDHIFIVKFWSQECSIDGMVPDSEFGADVVLNCRESLPVFKLDVKFEPNRAFTSMGLHMCYFEERVQNRLEAAAPSDGISLSWAPLEGVLPIGRAALLALQQVKADAAQGPLGIDATGIAPAPETTLEAIRAVLRNQVPSPGSVSVRVPAASGAPIVLDGSRQEFGVRELLSVGLSQPSASNIMVVRPIMKSVLYKLGSVRRGLQLEQPSAFQAALPADLADRHSMLKLPTFADVLKNEVAVDGETGLVKPVRGESLLVSGGLSSLAEAFVTSAPTAQLLLELGPLPGSDIQEPMWSAADLFDGGAAQTPKGSFTSNLHNDEGDLLHLAASPPISLWVLGQCDASGDYKTEACRRLAQKLGLQWLQPAYLLELAVKTPPAKRTPLMARCVEQLQRGLTVNIGDALRLTLEMMSSAHCKTTGYVLDFPPVGPSDAEAIAEFVAKVREMSRATEVCWEEFLRDNIKLPDRMPDPEPPAPPPAEGEQDLQEGGDDGPNPQASAVPDAPAEGNEGVAGDPGGEGSVASENAEVDVAEPSPPAVLVPNPLENSMPRRLVVLSMQDDEVAAWRLTRLRLQHAEREQRRKALEEAGEEVDQEEEEDAGAEEELPAIEDEAFDKAAGDILCTMSQFVSLPSLGPAKRLPPLPDQRKAIQPEHEDRDAVLEGEQSTVKILHDQHHVPMLALHADGRPPDAIADLLEAATGRFRAPQAPLPVPLQAAEGTDPKELLRLELRERQLSRRWSPWRQHCPVSLYEKALLPGKSEFSAEYAGYALLFADEAKQRRFCTWPKLFLSNSPQIDAPGMHLGYALLSPCGFQCKELAQRLQSIYDFEVVDVAELLHQAVQAPPLDDHDAPAEKAEGLETAERATETPDQDRGPRLFAAEKQTMMKGGALGEDVAVRLIAGALGLQRNLQVIAQQKADLAAAEKELEDAAAEEKGPPEHLTLDEETGKPLVMLREPLLNPSRGFVLIGFPESQAQVEALRELLRLELERVIVLAPTDADAPGPAEVLMRHSPSTAAQLPAALDSQSTNFEALEGIEGLQVEMVPLEGALPEQLVLIRKLIDPFYPIVDGESVSMEIPDPQDWNPEDAANDAGDDDAEVAEPRERPVIPWGLCGPYCPVTLKEDFWLFPGQKEFQHVFRNKVYAMAAENVSDAFVAEPEKYVPFEREPALPPPRILITGPTGSEVAKQCELLAQVYQLPVLDLEREWLGRVDGRLESAKLAKKEADQLELAQQAMVNDEGQPSWPADWLPKDKTENEEAAEGVEAPEEAQPEEDGLDDEARAALFVDAMRDVLGMHCGACILNGTFFGDLDKEELSDEIREARSLHKLLVKARRIPDLTIILRCKHNFAAQNCLDFAKIDREYRERREAYDKLCAEAEAEERDPPEMPEGLREDDEEVKESDLAKEKFIERKKAEQQLLRALADDLSAARGPLQKISVDRGHEPAHKAATWHCRPFMEHRASLLTRHQLLKVPPTVFADTLKRAAGRYSKFGMASPMGSDLPLYTGRPDAVKYATDFRGRLYFPRSEAEREQLLERPMDFIHLPIPSRISVHPAISICGPPLSGKTALARQLAERTGAVYLTVPEIVRQLCDKAALPCRLSQDIMQHMRRGRKIPDASIVEVLRHRLTAADVVSCGWILDDFPLTRDQAKLLTAAGIVPQRLLVVNVPERLIFDRTKEIEKAGGEGDTDLVQHEQALQRQRLDAYTRSLPLLRSYYSLTFDNVRDVEADRSQWAAFDHALGEITTGISQRLEYYRRTVQGKSAKISGMCFTPARIAKSQSPWQRYCPVSLTLNNELVLCSDGRCMVEYKAHVYWLASPERLGLFMDDPESFLQVPLPGALPHLLAAIDRRAPPPCQLEDYCPVALVDRKELKKGSGHHIVQFEQKHYNLENKEARASFMRRPERYVRRAELPSKKPALRNEHAESLLSVLSKGRDGRGLEPADMLTYMQASVAEVICQGLVESGGRRPLYPGRSPAESALLFLARFLQAKNPLSTAMRAAKLRGQFDEFLGGCGLPGKLKELSGQRDECAVEAWTAFDSQRFRDLCSRFDEVFQLPP